jgi:hypothetical protein
MTQASQQTATSVSDQLNEIGRGQSIPRNDGESDADYAERMVYELDVCVEELWACQDRIRELIAAE